MRKRAKAERRVARTQRIVQKSRITEARHEGCGGRSDERGGVQKTAGARDGGTASRLKRQRPELRAPSLHHSATETISAKLLALRNLDRFNGGEGGEE